jgi:filamentous hemagglutinin
MLVLVSVNHYNKFNVGNQGAILNNSKVMGTSQLGGAVYGNPNLNQNVIDFKASYHTITHP